MAEDKSVKEGLRIFKLVGYTLVFIAGTLLNILLFIAVTRKRIRHSNTSKTFITLMQNLAVADVLLLVLTIPFDAAWHETVEFPYGEAMCKILWPSQTATFQAVVFTYVLLSFHRTYGVKTYLFGQLKSAVGYLIILIIWIASISTVVPYMVFLKHTTDSNSTPSCDEDWKHVNHRKTYTVFLFLLQYLIPLLVMAGFFAVTWKELGSYRARGESIVVKRTDRHFRVTLMLIIYLCAFAILLLPHQIMWFILDFGGGDKMPYFWDVLAVLYVLTYSITISNPVLFFVYNVEFRSDMWYFLRCYFIREDHPLREVSDSFSVDDDPAEHSVREGLNNGFELKPDVHEHNHDIPGARHNLATV